MSVEKGIVDSPVALCEEGGEDELETSIWVGLRDRFELLVCCSI